MCNTPRQLYGSLNAGLAIDDGPIFNPKNINEASMEAQLSFAKALNKIANKQADVNIAKYAKDESIKGGLTNRLNMWRTPEALIPKPIYSKIDKKMTQWDAYYKRTFLPGFQKIEKKYQVLAEKAGKDTDKLKALEIQKQNELAPISGQAAKSYRDMLAKQFKQANEQIQRAFNDHATNPAKLDAALKKMGMTRRDAYYTNQYLNGLENGGPYFDFKKSAGNTAGGDDTQELVSTVTGKKVSFNPLTSLYNITEFMQKAPAIAGFKNSMGGLVDASEAAKKAGLTIYDRLPELEKAGIYANDYTPLRPEGKHDITARSQNALDNAAYFTGKRMGNVQKAMTGIAYRPKPWNDTFGFQDPKMKAQFGFMSFQARHMQQYGGWMKDAVINKSPEAAKQLAIYSVMTGILFGDRAAVPAPIYEAIKIAYPDIDKDIKELQGRIPILGDIANTGVVGATAKLATGGALDVDMTKYARPFGGAQIGVGQDIAQGAIDAGTRTIPKAYNEIRDGRGDKALAIAINGIVQISQAHKNGANALIQKTVDGLVKAYLEDEFTPIGIGEHLGKKYAGKDAVHKAN